MEMNVQNSDLYWLFFTFFKSASDRAGNHNKAPSLDSVVCPYRVSVHFLKLADSLSRILSLLVFSRLLKETV